MARGLLQFPSIALNKERVPKKILFKEIFLMGFRMTHSLSASPHASLLQRPHAPALIQRGFLSSVHSPILHIKIG